MQEFRLRNWALEHVVRSFLVPLLPILYNRQQVIVYTYFIGPNVQPPTDPAEQAMLCGISAVFFPVDGQHPVVFVRQQSEVLRE